MKNKHKKMLRVASIVVMALFVVWCIMAYFDILSESRQFYEITISFGAVAFMFSVGIFLNNKPEKTITPKQLAKDLKAGRRHWYLIPTGNELAVLALTGSETSFDTVGVCARTDLGAVKTFLSRKELKNHNEVEEIVGFLG